MPEEEALKRGLLPYAVPVLINALDVLNAEGIVRKARSHYVLLAPPKDIDLSDPAHRALADYIQVGVRGGAPKAYLCRHRNPWWWLGNVKPAPIVATYMARQAPAFALNPDEFRLLNVLHGLFPKVPMTRKMLSGLVTYLNEHRLDFRGLGRTYQGGLEKFEPREMESIPVPSLDWLRENADK